MPKRLYLSCLPLSLAAAFGAGDTWALGFARAQPSATLGAPLDFGVGLRLDPSELLPAECVSAEVWIGDAPLPKSSVSAVLEFNSGSPVIRIRTSVRVDEPIVTVHVTAGCDSTVSRRYTVFADPPGAAPALPTVAEASPASTAGAAVTSAVATPTQAPSRPLRPVAAAAVRPERAPIRPSVAAARPVKPAPGPTVAAKVDALPSGSPAAKKNAIASGGAGARLRLDAPSVTVASDQAAVLAAEQREAAIQALRLATNVAQVTAQSASSRVATMEAALETLKRESQANREAMGRLQDKLTAADERSQWTPWLLAAVLVMLGIAGWLYARLKRAETERQQAWWNSSHTAAGPGAAAEPVVEPALKADGVPPGAELPGSTRAEPLASPVPAAAPIVVTPSVGKLPNSERSGAVPDVHATQPLPAGFVVPDAPLRDVSIEELLDVEQQAEFFVVLGQDDAAIDLLMGHLRSSGGASPLPYLKLLEIYHRRGDQAAYERMRRRFNDRFNAVAPDWSTGLHQGRSLEDYPEMLLRVQTLWPRPVNAMADLETLLFRTVDQELFDLPAYRDVLFLFTLARDLQEMAQHDAPKVDVLLPLNQGRDFEDTGASAYLTPEQSGVDALRLSLHEPRPLSLDVTRPAPLRAEEAPAFVDAGDEPRARR